MLELYTEDYKSFLGSIKETIQQAQLKAMVTVNQQLLYLYWTVGNMILERQKSADWGDKILDQLSRDLKKDFTSLQGFSIRNLKYMRVFAREYPDFTIGQPPVAQITWSHNIILLEKCKSNKTRLWYAQKAIENGWSRDILSFHIKNGLYE